MQQRREDPGLPGREPAEGRPDLNLPGADHGTPINEPPIGERRPGDAPNPADRPRRDREPPDAPDADLPQRLGDRIENGPGPGVAGEPDLVPDVEVPEETM